MSLQQTIQAARDAGFRGASLVIAVAVAEAESGFNPNSRLLTSREDSRGLWQINLFAHPEYASQNLYDPATNARAAFAISDGGSNWQPWTTYTSGLYRRYLAGASAAVSQLADPCATFSDGTPLNWYQRFLCQHVPGYNSQFDNSQQNFEGLGGVDQPGGPVPDAQKPGAAGSSGSVLTDNLRWILVNVAGLAIILVALSRML